MSLDSISIDVDCFSMTSHKPGQYIKAPCAVFVSFQIPPLVSFRYDSSINNRRLHQPKVSTIYNTQTRYSVLFTAMLSITEPLDGITGELANNSPGLRTVLMTFIAVSWYNVFELVILILCTFQRWQGLYFWSLVAAGCLGVFPYSLGFLFKFFLTTVNSTVSVTLLTLGWWCMVTGQSLVLYSRLHLVLYDERILHRVLAMILVNFAVLHIPTTVLTFGANVLRERSPPFVLGYNVMEKIQMTGFTIQELVISALYVVETVRLLRLGWDRNRNRRKIMHQLVGINVCMFIMDLLLLGLEYASHYAVQITLKGVIYSIKLKLEFAVLGRLVDVVHGDRQPSFIQVPEPVPLSSLSSHNLLGVYPDRDAGQRVGAQDGNGSAETFCVDKERTRNKAR